MKNLLTHKSCSECPFHSKNFIGLSEEDLKLLDANKKEIGYTKGETIVKQGGFASHLVFVQQGMVKIVIENDNNTESILQIIPEGNFAGLSVLRMESFNPFSIIALKDTLVCLIKTETLKQLTQKCKSLCNFIVSRQNEEYIALLRKISILTTRSNHGKLATALIYLSSAELQQQKIYEYLTRKEIADLASVSLESANKILNELKNDKIIEIKGKHIEIMATDLIERLAKIG